MLKRLRLLACLLAFTFTCGAVSPVLAALPELPGVLSQGAVLIDARTGAVIFQKNMDTRYYPASTTKLMTALLALEYCKGDYGERITMSENAIFGIERGSSNIAMDVDETLSFNDALYALLLPSANEVAAAIGEHIGGSIEGFADMMNARASALGCTNTHFVNPHGLHDPEHYTTARDLSLILRECIKYDKFLEIIATPNAKIPAPEKKNEDIPLSNTNRLIIRGTYFYPYSKGGKTGYTDEARHTLASYAVKDTEYGELALIAATLCGEKNEPYLDAVSLFDYGFEMYGERTVLSAADFSYAAEYHGDGFVKEITLRAEGDISAVVPLNLDLGTIKKDVVLDEGRMAGLSEGGAAGEIVLSVGGAEIGEGRLFAEKVKVSEVLAQTEAATEAAAPMGQPSAEAGKAPPGAAFPLVPFIVIIAAFLVILGITATLRLRERRR